MGAHLRGRRVRIADTGQIGLARTPRIGYCCRTASCTRRGNPPSPYADLSPLIIGHLDVVEAPLASWSVDAFQLTEKDGYFYGRGVLDMKGEDTALLTALVRMRREGFKPDRDIVAAFTADEEAGTADGVQ